MTTYILGKKPMTYGNVIVELIANLQLGHLQPAQEKMLAKQMFCHIATLFVIYLDYIIGLHFWHFCTTPFLLLSFEREIPFAALTRRMRAQSSAIITILFLTRHRNDEMLAVRCKSFF